MAWGILTSIDLEGCYPELIRSDLAIKNYVSRLVELIEMKVHGDCQIVHFGSCPEVEGFTMMQMIETSLISGHFVNIDNSAYIDIFSCKPYDSEGAAKATAEFFGAKDFKFTRLERGSK